MDDILIRELMNGMWFVLSVQILIALIFYIINRACHASDSPQMFVVEPWYREGGVQLAVALITFMTGSGMRAGWIWVLLECEGRIGLKNCAHISETVGVLFVASFFAVAGGVCMIRVLLPQSWRPWSYLMPAIISVALPVVYNVVN